MPPASPPESRAAAGPSTGLSSGAVAAAPDASLACGNCRRPMRRVALSGHYDRSVDLDLCDACDWVWFDETETARLAGPGLLGLIGEMARAHAQAHERLRDDPRCPRCDGRLDIVHNQSRWGRSSQLQCVRRHGAYQSFAQFLQEKGLVRPMSKVDRARLQQSRGRIHCVNCGGEIDKADEHCRWCGSIPSLLDIARLAHALDPQDTIEPQRVHDTPAKQGALQCAACGAALPPGETVSCSQCGATLAITSLAEANAAVQALAPALREAAAKPSPEVVKRRLNALDADLPRRREWVAGIEAEARARRGHNDGESWQSLLSPKTNVARGVIVGVLVWLAWRFWR